VYRPSDCAKTPRPGSRRVVVFWRATRDVSRTPVLPIQIEVYQRLKKSGGVEIHLGTQPDLQAFCKWRSNQTQGSIRKFFACGKVTAWRIKQGHLSPERLTTLAEEWSAKAVEVLQ